MPRLTVVTVCFNNYEGLKMTVANVLEERSGVDIEYIIVDGDSRDESKAFLEEKAVDLDCVISETDAGLYDAMNKGAQAATGDFLLFMNAGDCFANGALRRVVSGLDDHDFIFFRTLVNAEDGRTWLFPGKNISDRNIRYWLRRFGPNLQSCCFSREFYKNNYFDLNFSISADMAYIGRAIQTDNWRFENAVCTEFYLGGISNTYRSFSAVLSHAREASSVNLEYFRDGRSSVRVRASAYLRFMSKFFLLKVFGIRTTRLISSYLNR